MKKWSALVSGYLLFVSSAFLYFEIPPLLEEIQKSIVLSDLQIGLLQGLYALPAVILAIIGGLLVDKYNSRICGIIAGFFLLFGNLLLDVTENFAVMLMSRVLVGIGTILINLVAARMLTIWFPPKQRGFAMSILHTAWPITAAISFSIFPTLGQNIGWHTVLFGLNLFTALTLLIFIIFAPKDLDETTVEAKKKIKTFDSLVALPKNLWLTALIWFFFVASLNSIMTFGADFLTERGINYTQGSFIIGLLMWTAIPGSLIAGWIIDRWGSLKTYFICPAAIIFLALLGFALSPYAASTIIITGIFAAFIPIAVYAMPGLLVEKFQLGLAFGVILTFSNLGNTIGPIGVGWINTISGNNKTGMLVSAVLICCIVVTAVFIRLKNPQNQDLESGEKDEKISGSKSS